MKKVFIKEIGKEGEVNDYFLVVKKGIYSSRNNTKYMSVRLRDASGQIEGKIWDRVDELSAGFERNDIVYVESRARMYQENMQLTITSIRKEERNLSPEEVKEFYPESTSDAGQLREEFFKIVDDIKNPHLRALFDAMKADKDLMERYCLVPASVGVHHVSVAGLLEHSVNLARMAGLAAPLTGGDKDIIITGALLHDIGKVDEITFQGGFAYTDRGRLLGHIALGVMLLDSLIAGIKDFPDLLADVLRHIIVSHHGEQEWGSPKKPMCIEAIVVHYLDNLDAKVMGVKEHMKENMEDDRWSQFHRLYESRFYKIPER